MAGLSEYLPALSAVDVAALLVVLAGAVRGCGRGLSGELARLAGAVAAFIFGLYAYQPFSLWIDTHTRLKERAAEVTAFLAIVTAAALIWLALRYVIGRIMKLVIEPWFNRWGGLLAGALRACVLVSIVFYAMNLWPHPYLNRTFGEESTIGRLFHRLAPALADGLSDEAG